MPLEVTVSLPCLTPLAAISSSAIFLTLLARHLVKLLGQVTRDGDGEADDAVGLAISHGRDGSRGSRAVNRRQHAGGTEGEG